MSNKPALNRIILSLILLVFAAALALGGFAAFSSLAGSGSNTLTAGTLALSKNANITGTVSDLKPGDIYKRCIAVSNDDVNAVDSDVTVYIGGDAAGSAPIANTFTNNVIKYSVEYGSGAVTNSASADGCANFVSQGVVLGSVASGGPTQSLAQTSNQSTAVNAALPGGLAAGNSKSFRIMFKLPSDAGNDEQSKALTYFLVFQAASTAGQAR